MTPLKWLLVLYGFFNIFLGVEAYMVKQSLVSLIAAGTAGILVLLAVGLTKNYPRIGYILAALVCVGLIGRFGPAYAKQPSNVYPALVVVLASALVLGMLIGSHFAAMRARKRTS